ncbi:uncharacterized protein LOC129966624 isoform X1 [Argiope bruennichi]|uniref:uncharacterized protein LOC129966624 isoform X1 n=1 Tax=Argiope bruennichi TaxID=94029 RepID=UPI002494224C|nr:uncharacterized protein LOC129966624 isoform X1 [Argiope bruennichi]
MAFILLLKRLLVVAIIFICFDGTAKMIKGCHPTSKALHICLNIYLEKDFPLIETFVKSRRHGRVLLEDPDLQNICRHIASLNDCYNSLWGECTSYWQVERYSRLIHLINSTHSYLCSNTTDVLKDLLINLDCLARARDYLAKCSHAGFNWMTTWKQIMRLRILSTESCPMLNDYKSCMVQELEGVICGKEASIVYGDLIEEWLKTLCNENTLYYLTFTSVASSRVTLEFTLYTVIFLFLRSISFTF